LIEFGARNYVRYGRLILSGRVFLEKDFATDLFIKTYNIFLLKKICLES